MSGLLFGSEVARLRKEAKISSRELSDRIGKNSSYVNKLENGKINHPDPNTCLKILSILGHDTLTAEKVLLHYHIISVEKETTIKPFFEAIDKEETTEDANLKMLLELGHDAGSANQIIRQYQSKNESEGEVEESLLMSLSSRPEDIDASLKMLQELGHNKETAQKILEQYKTPAIPETDVDTVFDPKSFVKNSGRLDIEARKRDVFAKKEILCQQLSKNILELLPHDISKTERFVNTLGGTIENESLFECFCEAFQEDLSGIKADKIMQGFEMLKIYFKRLSTENSDRSLNEFLSYKHMLD